MSGITFGTPAAANPSTSFSFGGLGGTSTSGFGFGGFGASSAGITAPTNTSLGTGFSFGSTSQTAATASLTFGGLGGSTLPASGIKAPSSTQAPTQVWGGLGGLDHKSPIKTGLGSISTKTNDVKTVKDNIVPAEILATVEEFNKHLKSQKLVRENIARMTSRPLLKVEEDLKDLRQQLQQVSTLMHNNSVNVDKLKKEVNQELKHVEIAQRTKDTPPGLQYENVQPAEYFQRLAEEFERQVVLYRQQFLNAEKFFASINQSSASNPTELLAVFAKLNDGFIFLAAKLQVVHESVKDLKDNYLQFRKKQLCETPDIFRKPHNGRTGLVGTMATREATTLGPSPFLYGSSLNGVACSTPLNQSTSMASSHTLLPNSTAQTGIFSQQHQQHVPQQSVIFGSSCFQSTPPTSVGVTLQRPGNKRGKNA